MAWLLFGSSIWRGGVAGFKRLKSSRANLRRAQNGDVTVLSVGAWTPRLTREENGNVVVT